MIIPVVAAGVGIAALAHGMYHRNSPVFGRALGRLPGGGMDVALTFDDGPNPVATPRILDVLAAEGVKATFFLLGKHVARWPTIARDIAAAGHVVGNHGWHHRKLHLRGRAYVRLDLALGTDAIVSATGTAPKFFRAPHGFRNPWVTREARALGQRCVGWSRGVWDSDRPGTEVIARRALAHAEPGMILLLHDGDGYDAHGDRTQTAAALRPIIRGLKDRGFRLVALP